MPNNCFGTLKITAKPDLLKTILDTVCGTGDEEGNPFDFNKIIPMPDNIYQGNLGPEEQELYGKNNWYDWSNENWGTKWNSCDTYLDEDTFNFWTAWSPCSPVIKQLAKMFPDARFDYWYEESGCCFCGEEIYADGKMIYNMEANYTERYIDEDDDECKQSPDFQEERDENRVSLIESINENITIGSIYSRETCGDCVKVIDGVFCEDREYFSRERHFAA